MNKSRLINITKSIVQQSFELCKKHISDLQVHVSYCAFFSQSQEEYDELNEQVKLFGRIANDTPTGPVYVINPIETVAGQLRVLKVRRPDPTRPERGDADFAIQDYSSFKENYLKKAGFKLIVREKFEMIELMDSEFNVRAYFSNPPVEEHEGIRDIIKKCD